MADKRICSIDNCGKRAVCRGWCEKHYTRWKRHGSTMRTPKIQAVCTIQDCGKKAAARGWCSGHYYRWRMHGDPLAGHAPKGEAIQFLRDVVLPHNSNECLIWPYVRSGTGYGNIFLDGKHQVVSRVVCEQVHGKPPTTGHEAAHSCGKGHEGCCNPCHLEWKTPAQNSADRTLHGTQQRGSAQWKAKLTADDVRKIRVLEGSVPQWKIGEMFGVAQTTIANVLRGGSWGWLD